MRGMRDKKRVWVALAATFALLLHPAAAGLVAGAMASAELLAGAETIICTPHGAEKAPATPSRPDHHGHLPECCLFGCSVAAGKAIAASDVVLPILPLPQRLDVAPSRLQLSATRLERSPINPRAPPVPA